MPFAQKLAQLRKDKGLTQEQMAKNIGVGIAQIRRYEKGSSSPTLEVIRNISKALGISADELIFDQHEGVAASRIVDRRLLEQFEMISQMHPQDIETVKTVLESMILRSRLEEIMPDRPDAAWSERMRALTSKFRKGARGYSEKQIQAIVDEAVTAVREEENQKARKRARA